MRGSIFRNVERFEIQEQSFLLPNDEVLTLLILPRGIGLRVTLRRC